MATVSADSPQDLRKLDQLLGGVFTMLSDPDLQAIRPYKMEHAMGGVILGDMGYIVIDRAGKIRKHVVDPLFGRNADVIVQSLKSIQ